MIYSIQRPRVLEVGRDGHYPSVLLTLQSLCNCGLSHLFASPTPPQELLKWQKTSLLKFPEFLEPVWYLA